MRDPEGFLRIDKDVVFRFINSDSLSLLYLRKEFILNLVEDNLLVPFKFIDRATLESPKISFVSQPHEWCFEQLKDAGMHTLAISKRISIYKMELKDASAWNILFDGCAPIFCDHLSFKKSNSSYWWAMGQFVRNFTLPLAIHKKKILKVHQVFRLSRDGIALDLAKRLLSYKIFFSRAFLFKFVGRKDAKQNISKSDVEKGFENIYEFLSWTINYKESRSVSIWSEYTDQRSHYSDAQIRLKKDVVTRWIEQIKPQWLADMGCNTGEFSEIAVLSGAKVISVDHDEECISRLYIRAKSNPVLLKKIHPVVFSLGDAIGSSGAGGFEFPSTLDRIGEVTDCVLMLGLLHHLLISESIPMQMLMRIISKITKSYAILELVDPEDVQHRLLCDQRNRTGTSLSIDQQIRVLSESFDLIEQVEVIENRRRLCLFKRKIFE